MDWFEGARVRAREVREQLPEDTKLDSMSLVEAAAKHLKVDIFYLPVGDPQLKGTNAFFDVQCQAICCVRGAPVPVLAGRIAHELGHVCLDGPAADTCTEVDVDVSQTTEMAPVGLQRVEDYGQRERRELRANVFARELLLTQSEARRFHIEESLGASAIAECRELPLAVVRQQLLDALLLPPSETEAKDSATPRLSDPSQDRAASSRDRPFLLQAGPGTGKTHTLIAHVECLLADKVDPASIAVMTFSNRAAGELHERLAISRPSEAPRIWIGTFHAFGLDLIRRYHDRLGLGANPRLYDRSDGIAMLEELLPTLRLRRYRDIFNPARELRDMLVAISRAKDELVDAAKYRELAEAMVKAATSDEELERAEKAADVGMVYERYESALRDAGGIDYGDLLMRPTLLLEQEEVLRSQLALRHRHLLVDEYQDVNRASARLLRAIAGDGKRLWVVGDSRQSIYRFRGASSANMKLFETDYPNAKIDQLEVNYRSSPEIVSALMSIAPRMKASENVLPLALRADRKEAGTPPAIYKVQTPADEIETLASSIRELEGAGVRLGDQAVLCRTNARLSITASALEAHGIAVLHLGSIFERDEIRDLLALLSLIVDRRGDGLVRIAAISRYRLAATDLQAVLDCLRAGTAPAATRLRSALEGASLSQDGRSSIDRLATDLEGFSPGHSPWELLTTVLLDRSRVLAELATKTDTANRMRAIAVWQFLNFLRQPVPGDGPPIRRLLRRVRMMVLLAEERDLRRVPAAALHMNAVRLMTVHASKGLEFDAVHIPGMTVAGFPVLRQGLRCPPPFGMIDGYPADKEAASSAHAEEEECLFFVGLSRSRRHLRLYSAAKQANGDNRKPSEFLEWIDSATTRVVAPMATRPVELEPLAITWPGDWELSHQTLISYEKCPRRFYYTHVLDLGTAREPTAYIRTRSCLYELIEWTARERATRVVVESELMSRFGDIWAARGPKDHPYAADYFKIGERLVRNLARSAEGRIFEIPAAIRLDLASGRLVVQPDEVAKNEEGVTVLRRVRTGYRRGSERGPEYDLLDLAGLSTLRGHLVEAVHLTDGARESITYSDKQRASHQKRTLDTMARIRLGDLPAKIDSYACPHCPHFFICPASPDGSVAARRPEES